LSCKHFLSEQFAENSITLWCTVAIVVLKPYSGTRCIL